MYENALKHTPNPPRNQPYCTWNHNFFIYCTSLLIRVEILILFDTVQNVHACTMSPKSTLLPGGQTASYLCQDRVNKFLQSNILHVIANFKFAVVRQLTKKWDTLVQLLHPFTSFYEKPLKLLVATCQFHTVSFKFNFKVKIHNKHACVNAWNILCLTES